MWRAQNAFAICHCRHSLPFCPSVTLTDNKNMQIGLAGSLAAHGVLFLMLAGFWGANARQMLSTRHPPVEREVTLLFPGQIEREPDAPAPKAVPVAAPQAAPPPAAPRMITPDDAPPPALAMRAPEPEAVRPAVLPPSSQMLADLERTMRASETTRLDIEVRKANETPRATPAAGPGLMLEPETSPPPAQKTPDATMRLAADALQNPVESAAGRHVTALIALVNAAWLKQTANQRPRGSAVISAFIRHDGTLARAAVLEKSADTDSLLTDLAMKAINSTRFIPTPAGALDEFPKEGVVLRLAFTEHTND